MKVSNLILEKIKERKKYFYKELCKGTDEDCRG